MNKKRAVVWLDGQFIEADKAVVPIKTHALHYGTSVFEGIRCYETISGKPAIFRLFEHVERLFLSADALNIKIPFDRTTVYTAVKETIKANELKECYIRPIFFLGDGPLGVSSKNPVRCAIMAVPWDKYFEKSAVSVYVTKIRRLHPKSAAMHAKVGGYYFNSVMANNEARATGADEALLLDHCGLVAEGAGQNIFLVTEDKCGHPALITPKLGNILPGITRDSIMAIAELEMGIKTIEEDIRPHRLVIPQTKELFFCGTAVEVCPIASVSEVVIGNGHAGPVSIKLKELYGKAVRGALENYLDWLVFV